MPRSATARVLLPDDYKPGSVLVVAPEAIGDELRLARLEDYLAAEFPHLDFTVTMGEGEGGMVGMIPAVNGKVPFSDAETGALVGRVVEAVKLFVDYGQRRH